MTFISYAQNFEDVILWRVLGHIEGGTYIDIGANDPNVMSVTRGFYERGWRGVNVDASLHWYLELEKHRPEDTNLNIAISDTPGVLTFYEIADTGLSTTIPETAQEHKKKHGFQYTENQVEATTVANLMDRHKISDIHFMSIDVEGAEEAVIRGIDWNIVRPWILVIEATKPMSQELSHQQWELDVLAGGYHFAYFDGLNRFYVADEHKGLLSNFNAPPNIFDDFISVFHVERMIGREALAALMSPETSNLYTAQKYNELVQYNEVLKQKLESRASARIRREFNRLRAKFWRSS